MIIYQQKCDSLYESNVSGLDFIVFRIFKIHELGKQIKSADRLI